MGVRDTTILKPLFEKHLRHKNIVSFDIETHGSDNEFYMGGIYSKNGYKSFYDKQEFIDEFKKAMYYGNTYVVATNLSFDLVGIYFNQKEWNSLDIVMIGGRMIFANLTNRKRQRLTFLDSLNYAPFSVELMGKILGLPKLDSPKALGKIPKNEKERLELEIYNKRDCEVTYKFMQFLDKGFSEAGGKMKTTIASTALDIFRRRYLRRSVKKESAVLGFNVEQFIFESYFGGRTEVFKRGRIENMKLYDINSLYPSAMLNEYPDPNTAVWNEQGTERNIKKYEGCTRVIMYCPKEMKYPLLPMRIEGKLIFPTGRIEGVFTHIEIRRALELGYELLKIQEQLIYKKTWYPFREYVNDLYEKRMKYKKEKNKMELVYKLLLNSLYGKFGQKNLTETVFFNKEFLTEEQIEKVHQNPNAEMTDDKNGVITEKKTCEESFVLPILCSYTTAHGRILLHKYLTECEGYYCDTDSIVTDKEIEESTRLGGMKLEYDIEEGVLVKPKMYYLKTKEGDEIVKLKGVPKKLLYNGDKIRLNKEIFYHILKGGNVEYQKFTKLKEGVKRGILPNSIINMEKYITLTDNKRMWLSEFDFETIGESEPICLT